MAENGSAPSPDVGEDTAELPTDAGGWRARLTAIPPRDLLRLLQKDRGRAGRILSGFRVSPDALRSPIVLSRLAEEAVRQPQFAHELADLPVPPPETPKDQRVAATPTVDGASSAETPDPRLRDKIREQRTALREKDARVSVLLADLAAMRRERDAARAEVEAARAEARTAQGEAERLRRRQQREERRASAEAVRAAVEPSRASARPEAEDAPPPAGGAQAPLRGAQAPLRGAPGLWEEALERLLSRGKPEVVAEVCREALLAANGSAAGRAALHALYAQALRAQGRPAAEQDRLAASAHLEEGNLTPAAEAFARALTPPARGGDAALLRRLLLLARRMGREEEVRAVFGRLRGTDRDVFRELSETIAAFGGRFADFLQTPSPPVVGPDEVIALPAGGLAEVTPRRLVAAVNANDAETVARARAGIAGLRAGDAPLADALLEAVAREEPAAIFPFSGAARAIVVDASNVARHDPDPFVLAPVPRVAHLRQMRDFLLRRGFFPIVMLADANLRFHVDDREAYLALVARGIVQETLPGTPADGALIAEANERGAPIVTNDRLADWEEARDVERIPFAILSEGIVSLTSL